MKSDRLIIAIAALAAFTQLAPAAFAEDSLPTAVTPSAVAPPSAVPWSVRLSNESTSLKAEIAKYERANDYGPLMAAKLHKLAGVYETQANFAQAAEQYKREISVLTKSVGADNPKAMDALRSLASVYEVLGNAPEARNLYEREYKLMKAKYGSKDMHLTAPLHSLGAIAENDADYDLARKYFAEELAVHEQAFGETHAANVPALRQLANIAEQKKDYQTAESFYLRELKSIETSMPRSTVLTANVHTRLGNLYERMHEFSKAEYEIKEAMAELQPVASPHDPYIPELLKTLSRIYDKQGRSKDAQAALVRANRLISNPVPSPLANL